jgi:hypothetical protein
VTKASKQFEELVARVEALLAPAGAQIKTPDRIRSSLDGRMREVDASIRTMVGSVPVLITIECRDKKRVQDQAWIEQLVTKKEFIGAAKTIAVSSRGISIPAMELARRKGIETRLLSQLPDDVIKAWISGANWGIYRRDWKLVQFSFRFFEPSYTKEQVSDAFALFSCARPEQLAIFRDSVGRDCSAIDIFRTILECKNDNDLDISSSDLTVHRRRLDARLPDGSISLAHGSRSLPITEMSFLVDFKKVLVGGGNQPRFGNYQDGKGSICYLADYSTTIDGLDSVECTLSFRKDVNTSVTSCGISLLDKRSGELQVGPLRTIN